MMDLALNVTLFGALASVTVLLVLYGILQPWWGSWFGWALTITLFSLWQIMVRAVVTVWLGEDYPGRDWVLLVGRAEIAIGCGIASIGLGRILVRSWRSSGRRSSSLGG